MQPGGLHLKPLSISESTENGGSTIQAAYRWRSDTAEADPGSGRLRYDDAVPANVTELYLSATTDGGADLQNILGFISPGDQIYFQVDADSAEYLLMTVTATIDNTGWFTIQGTVTNSGTLPSNNDRSHILILFGGTGTDAPPSGGLLTSEYRFSTTLTEADPGSGRFRYDDAINANVGEIYLSDENSNGQDLSNLLAGIEIGDRLYVQDEDDDSNFAVWNVVGPAPVDNTGWWTISVVLARDGAVLADNARCLLGLQVQGTGDLIYLRLDATNDPLTGDLNMAADVLPTANQQRNVGDDVTRFNKFAARQGTFVGQSASGGAIQGGSTAIRTFGTNPTGVMAGNQVKQSTGVTEHELGGGAFKSVLTMGNVYTYSTGAARLLNTGGGASLFGSAFSYGAGDAVLQVQGPAAFMTAYAYTGYGGSAKNHTLLANNSGSVLFGYSYGYGTVNVTCSGYGGFVQGHFACTDADGTTTFRATNDGSFAQGAVLNNTSGTALLESTGLGSFAQGSIRGAGTIRASGQGAFAQGRVNDGALIEATDRGTFAHGIATVNDIRAIAAGAFAIGDATNGDIIASGINSCQFGPGTNALADSLQVGVGISLRALGSTFLAEQAAAVADVAAFGQVWVKDDVPNALAFTDDAGQDIYLTGHYAEKASDESVANSTVLQNDDDFTFELEANAVYRVTGMIKVSSSSATPDWKFLWSEPDGTFGMYLHDTFGLLFQDEGTGEQVATIPAAVPEYEIVHGLIQTAGAGGTFVLQWAQNTSDAAAIVVEAGSWMHLVKVRT